jgi:hypothetical protein
MVQSLVPTLAEQFLLTQLLVQVSLSLLTAGPVVLPLLLSAHPLVALIQLPFRNPATVVPLQHQQHWH